MHKATLPNESGTLFIISAPSGAGKTSLVRELTNQNPGIRTSISHTTRMPRDDEEDGVAYHFIDADTFADMVAQNLFIEHAKVFDNYYGTSRDWVEEQLARDINVILDIDWQGARQIKSGFAKAVSIFILPPTYDALRKRLVKRNDNESIITRRMREAKNEISHYNEFDFVVINDDFDQALNELKAIILSTRLKTQSRLSFFRGFVQDLMAQKG